MALRTLTTAISLALHGLFLSFLLVSTGGASLESGTGEDMFVVEQGVAVEGIAKLGESATAVAAVEAEPVEVSEARQAVEEIKAQEQVEETPVIESKEGPPQEVIEKKPEEVLQPREEQVATIEQTQQPVIEEQQSSGAKKSGGQASLTKAHMGKMFEKIFRNRVASRRAQSGTVVVAFTIDRQGNLLSHKVEASSGSTDLDKAAITALEKAAPFPAWPPEIDNPPLTFTVPFKFTVR